MLREPLRWSFPPRELDRIFDHLPCRCCLICACLVWSFHLRVLAEDTLAWCAFHPPVRPVDTLHRRLGPTHAPSSLATSTASLCRAKSEAGSGESSSYGPRDGCGILRRPGQSGRWADARCTWDTSHAPWTKRWWPRFSTTLDVSWKCAWVAIQPTTRGSLSWSSAAKKRQKRPASWMGWRCPSMALEDSYAWPWLKASMESLSPTRRWTKCTKPSM
mmetsp:Transcript_7076/g.43599  ORF Transcript_7076/g.43599 Transcript_7076/m.43599 type:complete len:217 (+) Transcript_7076:2283-2933(+)